jgi:hypothetical protein
LSISHPNLAHPSEGRFSPTSLETACPRKYYLEKVIGLETSAEKQYLTMGTATHLFIEHWQKLRKSGLHGRDLFLSTVDICYPEVVKILPSWPGDKYSFENWLFTCEGYHSRWQHDNQFMEYTESLQWIPMGNGTLLGGVMDSIYRKPQGLVIRDTKTTGRNLTDWFWKGMENKFQLSIYYHMLSVLFPNEEICGVEIDAVVISNKRDKLEDNFQRRLYDRTDLQQAEAVQTYRRKTEFYMKGLALPTEEEKLQHFYQEQSQCGNYGGCPFLEICTHGLNCPSVYTDFKIRERNPVSE